MTVPSYSGPPSLPIIGTKSGQRPAWPQRVGGGDVPAEHLPRRCECRAGIVRRKRRRRRAVAVRAVVVHGHGLFGVVHHAVMQRHRVGGDVRDGLAHRCRNDDIIAVARLHGRHGDIGHQGPQFRGSRAVGFAGRRGCEETLVGRYHGIGDGDQLR